MNHFIYMVVKYFPFWAIPMAWITIQLGVFFKRKNSSYQYQCWAFAGFLCVLAVVWLGFRGDIYSDQWLRKWE